MVKLPNQGIFGSDNLYVESCVPLSPDQVDCRLPASKGELKTIAFFVGESACKVALSSSQGQQSSSIEKLLQSKH